MKSTPPPGLECFLTADHHARPHVHVHVPPRTAVMRVSFLLACLALPILSAAQVFLLFLVLLPVPHTPFTSPVLASICLPMSQTLHPNCNPSNSSSTITPAPSSTSQSGSASGSGSSGLPSTSGSSARNATTTASTTTVYSTAPSSVSGENGGGPGGQAPSPGQSASNGMYGPPDSYIAAAEALRCAGMLGFLGLVVGGAFVLV